MYACFPVKRRITPASLFRRLAGLFIALLAAVPVQAQQFETVGTRAMGMGGAFVAVADDITAVYWNPAGLACGPLFNGSVQHARAERPIDGRSPLDPSGGSRTSTEFVGFAVPSLGVSYLRIRTVRGAAPTATAADSRQDGRPEVGYVSRFAGDQLGVTLLQSLAANLVAGSTLRLIRGSFVSVPTTAGTWSDAAAQGGGLSGDAATRFDLDVGILAWTGPLRVGMVGRNLRRADFSEEQGGSPAGADPGRADRQVRVGFALTPGFAMNRTAAAAPSLTLSVDADLTRARAEGADERHVAAGVERWFMARRLALRGGVSANTVGAARPIATAGASVAIRPGMLVEAQFGRGGTRAGQSWSVAGRVSY